METNALPEIEKAWQTALDQLHAEMPRTWFESWVKPAYPVSLDDGWFTIGCSDAYQRDWLADRLTSTLARLLTGILNQAVHVRFIFQEPTSVFENPTNQDPTDPQEGQDDPVELEVLRNSIRNFLIEPERVVRLPVYFLRWLPYVGAQILFLVVALWQEYYLSSNRKPHKGNPKVGVRVERICQWAGLSRAQFFRLVQPGGPIGWFAQKRETEHEIDRRTGHAKKSPNQYVLYDTPLTPGDAVDLHHYLHTHGFENSPEDTLRAALIIDPKQILRYPIRTPPEDFPASTPHPITVQDIVKEFAGRRWNAELSDLTDQLADRLTRQGEFILISWYFLQYWLPALGPNAAMLILLLRNLCYFNDDTGEIRDEVWIEDGYDGIAARLGIANPQLIANWFPVAIEHGKRKNQLTDRTQHEYYRRRQTQEWLGLFVRRVDRRFRSSGRYDWKFKVQRTDPLIPEHETLRKALTTLVIQCEDQGTLDELVSWLGENANHCIETVNKASKVVLRLSMPFKDCSETLKLQIKHCNETLGSIDKDCFETLLKILKSIRDSKIDQDTPSSDTANPHPGWGRPSVVVVSTDLEGNWSLEKLLSRADPQNRQALLAQEDNPLPFVSWLIHGSSQPVIQNPYGLAIAKLKASPKLCTGGASERLAALPPVRLAQMIEQALGWSSPSHPDWALLFGSVKSDRIRLLADVLGIELDSRRAH